MPALPVRSSFGGEVVPHESRLIAATTYDQKEVTMKTQLATAETNTWTNELRPLIAVTAYDHGQDTVTAMKSGRLLVPSGQRAKHYRCLLLATVALLSWAYPGQVKAQNVTVATNNRSEWFATRNGWSSEDIEHGTAPPTGKYSFIYKHWFEPPATGEPPAWTTHKTHTKPPAGTWDGTTFGTDEFKTNDGDSYDVSWWYVKLKKSSFWSFWTKKPPIYYSNLQTYSKADAAKGSGSKADIAGSKTKIVDPFTLSNPGTGDWQVTDHFALFGEVEAPNNASFIQYDVGLSVSGGSPAANVVSVIVGGENAAIVVNDDFLELFGGRVAFADAYGNILSQEAVEAKLNSYYNGGAWRIDPSSFDISTFDPTDPLELSQVFAIEILIDVPSSYSEVTVYTDSMSSAIAAAP
jgi:hypothetical protein